MNGAAMGLGLLVAGLMMGFVTWPWWGPRVSHRLGFEHAKGSDAEPQDEVLAGRYGNALAAMRDLDFDHTVGKVTYEDYTSMRSALLEEAARAVAELDERSAMAGKIDDPDKVELVVIGQPADTAGYVPGPTSLPETGGACMSCGWDAQPGSVYCTQCGAKLDLICSECGRQIDATDLFCGGCGTKLALAVP